MPVEGRGHQCQWKGGSINANGREEHQCTICYKVFANKTNLTAHHMVHTGEKPYQCTHCEKGFRQKGALKTHIKDAHSGMKWSCHQCGKDYATQLVLERHFEDFHDGLKKQYQCQLCTKSFHAEGGLNNHLNIEHDADKTVLTETEATETASGDDIHTDDIPMERTHICTICSAVFSSKHDLLVHKYEHAGEKPFKCAQCERAFRYKSGLKTHIRETHSGVGIGVAERSGSTAYGHMHYLQPYGCAVCGIKISLTKISNLAEHVTQHEDTTLEKPFQCNLCDETFADLEELRMHVKNKKDIQCKLCGKSYQDYIGLQKHVRDTHSPQNGMCNVCGKGFSSQSYLKTHIERVHNKPERNLKCHICEKTFGVQRYLIIHMESHKAKKFVCEICGKDYTRNFDMQTHMRSIHTGERPYKCTKCDASFARKNTLDMHQAVHTRIRYPCTECTKSFTRKSDVQTHMKFSHLDRKGELACDECDRFFDSKQHLLQHKKKHLKNEAYPCSECGKAFPSRKAVIEHQRLTGEKPFKCAQCNRAYLKRYLLKVHMRSHTGEKPYECKKCRKTFRYHSCLTNHMRLHTGERPYKCPICNKGFRVSMARLLHMRTHSGLKPEKCDFCDKAFAHPANLRAHRRTHTGQKPYRRKVSAIKRQYEAMPEAGVAMQEQLYL